MGNNLYEEDMLERLSLQLTSSRQIVLRTPRLELKERVSVLIEELYELFFPYRALNDLEYKSKGKWFYHKLVHLKDYLQRMLHDNICVSKTNQCQDSLRCYHQTELIMSKLPIIREKLYMDVHVAIDQDPAASSLEEVIIAYPGIFAIMAYRIAHEMHRQGIELIPRLMTEYAHEKTGIDIHPGVQIGKGFFIDHGTGIVIGETCHIGDFVRIYQGVTLGAISVSKRKKTGSVTKKRHPTVENDVIIYAGATILGGDTIIGKGSIIGGNVWIMQSVPPFSKVTNSTKVEFVQKVVAANLTSNEFDNDE